MPCNVLCLHGYGMNATNFEHYMRHAAAALPEVIFHFIDGPSHVDTAPDACCWWTANKDEDRKWVYDGVEAALERVRQAEADIIASTGEGFSGVLGFSQGAALASLIAALHGKDRTASPIPSLRFAVLLSGFIFRDTKSGYAGLFSRERPIDLPSLHVFSDEDGVVPSGVSRALSGMFRQAEQLEHTAGHRIPADSAWLATLKAFTADHSRVSVAETNSKL